MTLPVGSTPNKSLISTPLGVRGLGVDPIIDITDNFELIFLGVYYDLWSAGPPPRTLLASGVLPVTIAAVDATNHFLDRLTSLRGIVAGFGEDPPPSPLTGSISSTLLDKMIFNIPGQSSGAPVLLRSVSTSGLITIPSGNVVFSNLDDLLRSEPGTNPFPDPNIYAATNSKYIVDPGSTRFLAATTFNHCYIFMQLSVNTFLYMATGPINLSVPADGVLLAAPLVFLRAT